MHKSAPTALSQSHQDVLDFKTNYNLYLSGDPYENSTLSIEDAEWLLEASFNYDHMLENFTETDYGILHNNAETVSISTGVYEGTPTATSSSLFEVYDDLLTLSSNITNIAPMSDLEIETDENGNFVVSHAIARVYAMVPNLIEYPGAKSYSDYHFAVTQLSGPGGGGSSCPGTVGSDMAYEILQHNLRYAAGSNYFNSTGTSGYFYSINSYSYGTDAFDDDSYEGPLSQDYSLDIWGANQSINASSPANGEIDQCISDADMQDYESAMNDIADDHTLLSAQKAWEVKVDPVQTEYLNTSSGLVENWHHHRLSFRVGIKRSL